MSEEIAVSKYLDNLPAIPNRTETLILRAEKGEKLEANDRRDAVAYLAVVRPDISFLELGRLFQCSDTLIRKDKEIIRKRLAEELSGDDVKLVIHDIRTTYERFMGELESSTRACAAGTANRLNHLKAKMDYQIKFTEMLQSLGFLPKNLGNMTKTSFIYKAVVTKGGGVNVVPVESKKELTKLEAEEIEQTPELTESAEDQAIRAALEAEFADAPRMLPPAKEEEL